MPLDDIRDIKPPVDFPGSYALLIIVGIVLVIALVAFLISFFKKKIKTKDIPVEKVYKSANQLALEALAELKRKNLPQKGRLKEYYFLLSDIARHYMEDRFQIRAPEMTTEEFLSSLRDSGVLSGMHKNLLKEFLNLCDIVKFAKYAPAQKETDESFEAAVRLIDETKQTQEEVQGK